LEKNCSVVICNGQRENAITEIIKGKNIGTFFSFQQPDANAKPPVEVQAMQGKTFFSHFIKFYKKNSRF
jgi:glutamate 5-kinase